jgi:serine protease Do
MSKPDRIRSLAAAVREDRVQNGIKAWLWMLGLAVAMFALVLANGAKSAQRPGSFADLAAQLKPAVVNVSTTQSVGPSANTRRQRPQAPPGSPFEEFFKEFFDDQEGEGGGQTPRRRAQSLGSGFIIDKSGIVVTNYHVIAEADEITVILDDNTSYPAKLIGHDKKTDLAVLKFKTEVDLPAVPWGDSEASRVGDWVLAIGNPFGLGGSVTAGIISARGRNINAGPYDNFIQTDASINRGNSGGPMFNLDGEVVGINTAIFSPSGGSVGIGFAIPANLAKRVVQQLVDFGRTKRGWLGVQIQTVNDEIAESLGLDKPRGALVSKVNEQGPADAGGIVAGDVILEFSGREVEEMRSLPRIVADTAIGETVNVVVWRKGSEKKLRVKVGELEEIQEATFTPNAPTPGRSEVLGMSLSSLTSDTRSEFQLGDVSKGVVVTGVAGNSTAAERGIRPGDLIVEVNQEPVASPQEVTDKIKGAQDSGRKTVLLLVERAGDLRFVAVRLDQG